MRPPHPLSAVPDCFRQMLDSLPNCLVFVVDERLRVTFAGGALQRLLPPLPDDGAWIDAWLPATLLEATVPHLEAAFAGEPSTFACECAGGCWLQMTAAPQAGDLRSRAVQVTAFDITQQKKACAAQEAATQRLSAAVDAAHIGIWDWDVRTNQVTFSPEWKRQTGYSDDEIGSGFEEWQSRVHPDDIARALQTQADVLARGQSHCSQEFRFRHKDGHYRHIWAQSVVYYDEGGRPQEVYGTHIDITERKLAEDALRASEAALRWSQALAHVGHWSWDLRTGNVYWSDEMKRILGYTGSESDRGFVGAVERAVHPDDLARVRRLLQEVVEGHKTQGGECRVVWPDGGLHHIWVMPSETVCDEEGRALLCSGVVQDITERKRAEAAGAQQARLAAVGQLAAGIAHDFNNILSIILIYAELLGAGKNLSDKERERAETIVGQTMRATRMIRQILDFSRQSVFQRHALDLLPLLKEQVKLLKQTLPENIAVELHYAPGEYWILADPTRMQQMVMNLALNARDAMPHGGTLRIALSSREGTLPAAPAGENGGACAAEWVQIEVEDTGEGMSAPVQARLFEPFFTTKEVGKGVGLGLAQVHGIVAQHDGCIDVRSAPGAGSCFRVLLPAHADSQTAAAGGGQSLRGLPRGNGQCVLLVEDDEALRVSLAELLEGLDYAVVQAADGEEALRHVLAQHRPVDLVISDIAMPRMGGIELVKALRQMGNRVPVILMSGHDSDLQSVQMRVVGASVFLPKPPSGREVAIAAARLLGSHTQ